MATIVAGKQKETLLSQLFEIERQIRQKKGYPYNPKDLQEHLQDAIEGKFLSVPAIQIAPPKSNLPEFLLNIKLAQEKLLSEKLKRNIVIKDDEFPIELTSPDGEKNLAIWQEMKFHPIFLPGMTIHPTNSTYKRVFQDWVMPPEKFFNWSKNGKLRDENDQIIKNPFTIKRGFYLADANQSVDYNNGIQVYPNDTLSTIITNLRGAERVDRYNITPLGSRFAITPTSEWPLVCDALKNKLNVPQMIIMPYKYFVAIGNLYYLHYGQYNSWLWFKELFEDSDRLYGGNRDHGGLAHICYYWNWHDHRIDLITVRPLGVFA